MDRLHPQGTIEDVLYLKSSQLKWMSLGYTGLMADIYWTRAVQYYGGEHSGEDAPHYELLAPLLNITTDLDPKLTVAYEIRRGLSWPPSHELEQGCRKKQSRLWRKGIRANPDNWHFVLLTRLPALHGIERLRRRRERIPARVQGTQCSPWLTVLAGKMAQKSQ